jgi:hypothetical protein
MTTTATTRQIATGTRMAIIGTALAFNGAFYWLSSLYFDAHKLSAPGVGEIVDTTALGNARWAFFTLTMLVCGIAVGASMAPRIIGHVLAVVIGLGALAGVYGSLSHHMPSVMTAVLIAVAVLLPTLAHFSWRGSRAAWSFMISIICVFGIVTFFGAPKVRNILGIGFWTAMLLPAIQFAAVAALSMVRGEYRTA